MMIRRMSWWMLVIAGVLVAAQAGATTWWESADVGELLGTADAVVGVGALTQINGSFPGPDDVDMYLIQITDPNTFSASGTGGLPFGPPRMFLFDSAGVGVTGYFDSANIGATITNTFVTSPGLYYLAYSGYSHPLDAPTAGQALWATTPTDVERIPDGLAAANPVAGWSASIVPFNPVNCTITLTGASFIPEPITVLLLATGAAIGLLLRRRA